MNHDDKAEERALLGALVIDHMDAAAATKRAADKRIREEFQIRHPHYIPSPGSSAATWVLWENANIALHGLREYYARFPRGTNT